MAQATPALAIDPVAAATELMALTNIARTSNGLHALSRDSRLSVVGVSRSEDMIKRSYFAHEIPPAGTTVVDVVESLGVRFRLAGENIEFNTALDFATVQYAQTDFMNSPSHRKNIMDKRWDRMGAGVYEGGGKRMYTVVFMLSPAPEAATPGAPAVSGPRPGPEALPARTRGERVELALAPTGLMDSLINRLLRLFLSL